jgi:hypothetical protein
MVDGVQRTDRCNNFGGRASAMTWCAFMSLVPWIANFTCAIEPMLVYMDDNFSFDVVDELVLYPLYATFFPSKQVRLLALWDDIGLPHEKDKQEFGRTLVIMGFLVDPQAMTISLNVDKQRNLVLAIRDFIDPSSSLRRKRKLREWLHLLGRMSWGFNVCPFLRPALSSGYCKVAAKNHPMRRSSSTRRSNVTSRGLLTSFPASAVSTPSAPLHGASRDGPCLFLRRLPLQSQILVAYHTPRVPSPVPS